MTEFLELAELETDIAIIVSDAELEADRAALEESIAFQVGKDWGLDWRQARIEARRIVRRGIKGTRIG